MYLLGTFVVDGVPPEDQDDLDFFTFPTLDASIGNDALDAPIDGFCVSAAGDNQDAGKAFIKWLGSAEAADAGNNAASAPFIAANAGASTAKYGELQKKSAEVVQNAKSIAQFLDRDTNADLANTVLSLYDWLRTQPHYENWLDSVCHLYDADIFPENHPWGKILLDYAGEALRDCKRQAEYALSLAGREEDVLAAYGAALASDAAALESLRDCAERGGWDALRAALQTVNWQRLCGLRGYGGALGPKVKEIRDGYKKTVSDLGKKQLFASEKEFREDVALLAPLARDLFSLTMDFDRRYSDKKRENLLLDYADLEHFTLGLLTERDGMGGYLPTAAAREISARYEYILVDECQDINAAQDAVFRALSRNGKNLFYVGDVKQSIYRFRQAMPELFLQKRDAWPVFDGSA